ncbi:Competence protein F [Minicystis rosea]|nr:Competence protein F [Minicystis rosea]
MTTVIVLLRALVSWLADVLAPPVCAACDARLPQRAVFCGACAHAVVLAEEQPALDGAPPLIAFALFGGAVADALRRLKYSGRSDLGVPLGHLVRRAARSAGIEADVVIPVPLHPARLAERGYNQAALLGAEVANELAVPLFPLALARTRHTPQQARLDRASRLGNVTGAFRVRMPAQVRGRRVLLVDDVSTTGATLAACAAALREAGAAAVTSLVVARTAQADDGDLA